MNIDHISGHFYKLIIKAGNGDSNNSTQLESVIDSKQIFDSSCDSIFSETFVT